VDLIGTGAARFDELLDFGDDVVGAVAITGLKLRAVLREERSDAAVPFQALINAKSPRRRRLQNEVAASNSRVSLPSATMVP